jgi:hypothetical protein
MGRRRCQEPLERESDLEAMLAASFVRPYAIRVRNNLGVSNADKTALGLTVVDLTRTPVPPPVTSPLLNVVGSPKNRTRIYAVGSPTFLGMFSSSILR